MKLETYEALELHRVVLRGGAGRLRFGMTPAEVRQLLGDPDYESAADILDERTLWSFDPVDLNVIFRDVGGRGERLVKLYTENPAVRLLDVPLVGRPLSETVVALERLGVRHQSFQRLKGIDFQYFDRGLMLHTFGDMVERAEWTILPDGYRDGEIDWTPDDRLG